MYNALEQRVLDYISLKQEGEVWDFKREWYKDKYDLLHDIICMSNTLDSQDAIIIIGCDEENDYQIVDVSENENRRDTAQMVVFLRDKKFAGGVRPIVFVHTMITQGKTIDVIVIKNTRNTPYYLSESFGPVHANNIYTRVMDTNTPRDKSADPDRVEKLWMKRFSLDASAIEKAMWHLKDPDNWDSIDGAESYYNKTSPEFTITIEPDERDGYEYYLFGQMDKRPHWYNIYLKYHQTVLYSTIGISLDGGRYFSPCPEATFMRREAFDSISFSSFTKGTLRFELNKFFYAKEMSGEADYCRRRFFECIPVFSSEMEKKAFLEYGRQHFSAVHKLNSFSMPEFPQELPNGQNPEVFREEYQNALKVQELLRQYRMA